MAVPKKKTSRMKTKLRRSHQALSQKSVINCPQCGETKVPHRVCRQCGYYKGKAVFEVES